jgi:hypothetical protein
MLHQQQQQKQEEKIGEANENIQNKQEQKAVAFPFR